MWTTRQQPIGVEVDADLSGPLSSEARAQFRELFFEHSLLVFRDQRLSPERQTELCSLLGPVPRGSESEGGAVHEIALDGALGATELVFHSDFAFDEEPYVGVSLHALDVVPAELSSTDFVSGHHAYETLPEELRAAISDKLAEHSFPLRTDRESGERPSADFPSTMHPVVWAHPETGRPVLFVSKQTTTRIDGMSPSESRATLTQLFAHLYRADAVYSHKWRTGDAIFWDNRALQHARPDQSGVVRRRMQRVVIGRGTVGEIYGDFIESHREQLRSVAHSAPPAGGR
jgi:taurine dioxygenase